MADYQELYFKLFRATESAIRTLVEAQRECEELYLSAPDPVLIPLPRAEDASDYTPKP